MADIIADGQLSFEGGQDSSLPPSRLPENNYAAAVNVTTSKGVLRPRYAYERKKLEFPPGGYSYKFDAIADFKNLFISGKFQALVPYRIDRTYYLIIVISGVIYLVNQTTFKVTVLTLNADTQLSDSASRINWGVAGKYVVLCDYPSRPVIIEGQTARRSRADESEIPVANMGVYNGNRFMFSNFGNEFTASDPVGNALTPNAPITVFEIETPQSDFFAEVYQLPSRYNSPITAMANLQFTDSSTGIGQLVVASNKEIFAYNTTQARSEWLTSQFGISLTDQVGIVGPRAITNVSSDLFFVSPDGQLRSMSMSRDEQKKWARIPMSLEVENWVSYISPELIPYSVVCYFKNKIFWSVRPYRIPAKKIDGTPILDVAHSGFLVLETDNVARSGQTAKPAWAGLWTGIRPLDMCVTDERMFVMSKDYYNRNTLYEVDPELSYDRTVEGQRRYIRSVIYTREHFFKDLFSLKSLQNVELGISDIRGKFEVGVDWKPSDSANFLYWANFKHNVPFEYTEICDGDIKERLPLAFKELRFGMPDTDEGNPVTQDIFDNVKRVQLRITLEGATWQLNEYRIQATNTGDNTSEYLPENLPETTQFKEAYSDWTYEEFGI